jgi:membrane protein required for colicin V production
MNALDWFIIALIVFSSLFGAMRGLAREAIALLAWLLGLWLAWNFSYLVEPDLGGVLAEPGVKVWVARLIILTIVLLLASLVGVILSYFVRHSPFSAADRILGLLFGLLRGVVLVGTGVIVAQLLQLDGESWWRNSQLLPYANVAADVIRHLVNDVAPSVRHATGVTT